MRLRRRKKEPEALLERATSSFAAMRGGANRAKLLKAGLIAGGVAALTAGSTAISSLRRRREANS
jgi:hypothetical protein